MPKPSPVLLLLLSAALATHASAARAGECEDNFRKSGSALSGTDFSSAVLVPDLSVTDALGQVRGIMVAEGMDVITEDVEGGSMLVVDHDVRFDADTLDQPAAVHWSPSAVNTTVSPWIAGSR